MKSSGNPSQVVTRVPSGRRMDNIRAAAMSKFVNLLSSNTNLDRALLIVLLASAVAFLSACGGGSSNPGGGGGTPAISVALSSPPTSVQAGATAMLTAVVTNDSANGGVNWSCAPASACGSFNPTTTASGAATTYTAPATAPSGGSVTVTATSVTDATKTATATIAISAATAISVAITSPPTSVAPSATAQLTATVTNDSSNGGVTWSCTPAGSCGSFNPTQTASGSATTYTAPGAAPSGGSVTVTATSVTDTTKSATATITISSGTASTTLSAGTYVLYATGLDSAQHLFGLVGAVQLDGNGNVIAGEQDFNDANGLNSNGATADTISGGSYTTKATGQGTMTLTTSNTKLGVSGTETLSITVVNSKHVLITELDSSATSSGSLDLQTLANTGLTQLVGSWSFEDVGENNAASYSQGGVFTLNAPSQTGTCTTITPPCSPLSNIVTDFDEIFNGSRTVTTADGTGSGYFSPPDASGRGQAFFGGIYWDYYIVGPEVIRMLGYFPQNSPFDQLYVGSAYGQGANSTFSAASFKGPFVFTDASTALGTTYAAAGEITLDGTSVVSGFADVSEGTATPTSAAVAGSYQMDLPPLVNGQPSGPPVNGYGRITITPGTTQDISVIGMYAVDPALNISDPNNATTSGQGALLVDLDSNVNGAGVLLTQSSTSGVVAGNYAVGAQIFTAMNTVMNGEADLVGQAAANSSAVFTGTVDVNDFAFHTGQNLDAPFSVTLAADGSNPGRFTAPLSLSLGGNTQSFTLAFYQVSASQFVMVVSGTGVSGTGTIQSQ